MPYGPAARLGDMTSHGSPLVPGIGSTNVLIESRPAWRALMDFHVCPIVKGLVPDVGGMVMLGSPTVLINSMMACRVMDMVVEIPGGPNPIAMGAAKVFIGDSGTVMVGSGAPGARAAVGGTATPRSALSSETAAAQAKTLIEAAKAGVPFCEKCAQAALAAKSVADAEGKRGQDPNPSAQGQDQQTNDQNAAAGGAVAPGISRQSGSPANEASPERKTWVEIKLVNKQGKPVAGQKYRVTPPDGKPVEGTLDATGTARVDNIDPGSCKVTFPDLDGSEWEPR